MYGEGADNQNDDDLSIAVSENDFDIIVNENDQNVDSTTTDSIAQAPQVDTTEDADATLTTETHIPDTQAEPKTEESQHLTEENEELASAETKTRTGRKIKPIKRFIESEFSGQLVDNDITAIEYPISLSPAEERFYDAMERFGATINREVTMVFAAETAFEDVFYDAHEFLMVGAGLGGGFTNTTELHVMTYDQAMKTEDKDAWCDSVDKEHERMTTNKVFTPTYIKDIPEWATVLTTKWAMKKKSNGTLRARMVARGFEQIDGEHYDEHDKSSPVVSEITIRIVFVIMLMAGYWAEIIDVCGAFLLGNFKPEHKMYIEIPQGFEKFYPPGIVLLLNKRCTEQSKPLCSSGDYSLKHSRP